MGGGLEHANLKKDRVVGEGMGMSDLKAQKKRLVTCFTHPNAQSLIFLLS